MEDILCTILSKNSIKNVIVSNGLKNSTITSSLKKNNINVYSFDDDRTASYFAIGLYEESEENIALICNNGLSFRNYMPAITEAYYRKFPLLIFLLNQNKEEILIDNKRNPSDLFVHQEEIDLKNIQSINEFINRVNICFQLSKNINGGGPVLININDKPDNNKLDKFNLNSLDIKYNTIYQLGNEEFPSISNYTNIAFYISFSVDCFSDNFYKILKINNIPIYASIDSGLQFGDVIIINDGEIINRELDLIICIGNICKGIPFSNAKEIWYITEDLYPVKDIFKLDKIFKGTIKQFIYFIHNMIDLKMDLYKNNLNSTINTSVNTNDVIYVERDLLYKYLEYFKKIRSKIVTRCFNEKGCILSSAIGASIIGQKSNYICILKATSLLYDLNSIGNRHISKNLSIIVELDANINLNLIRALAESWYYDFIEVSYLEPTIGEIFTRLFSNKREKPVILIINRERDGKQ